MVFRVADPSMLAKVKAGDRVRFEADRIEEKTDAEKKPYQPPTLVRWGTLGDITQTVGASGKDDNGRGYCCKTRHWMWSLDRLSQIRPNLPQ